MVVKLLSDGGYNGAEACVGKIFMATDVGKGAVDISLNTLYDHGYEDDGSTGQLDSLYFFASEIEVLDKDG